MKNDSNYSRILLCICCVFFLMQLAVDRVLAEEKLNEGYLSEVRPGPKDEKTPVNIGVVVIDIDTIDGANQSFVANFAVSSQWRDPRLAKDTDSVRNIDVEDIWSPNLQILNQQKLFKTFPEKVEVSPDGTVIYRQRFWGTLSYPMNLKDFPIDHHSLQIRIVSVGSDAEDIKFSIAEDRTDMAEVLTVTDWQVLGWDAYTEAIRIGPKLPVVNGVVFEFEASRLVNFYIIKVLVPLVMIVFMSLVVLFIDPVHVGPKFSIAITAILTLIAYRFLLGNLLPKISYLTHMDYFLFGSMFLVFAVLVETSVVARFMGVKKEAPAKELDYWSRWAFVVLFILIVVFSFLV